MSNSRKALHTGSESHTTDGQTSASTGLVGYRSEYMKNEMALLKSKDKTRSTKAIDRVSVKRFSQSFLPTGFPRIKVDWQFLTDVALKIDDICSDPTLVNAGILRGCTVPTLFILHINDLPKIGKVRAMRVTVPQTLYTPTTSIFLGTATMSVETKSGMTTALEQNLE
ncbi:hypothetical protein EVAR_13075_1 [Eumeta japonica]|uniref:Uncharacterized protein n=1 Tax=Eumeta variegata TaxID=151549 RepID=A0A4C2A6C5_EUMVA|nr:hypothetical protein EVAR_13075_1 [Eumeta japonica]